MREFTTEEIEEIKVINKKHKNLSLSEILFEEKYSKWQICKKEIMNGNQKF